MNDILFSTKNGCCAYEVYSKKVEENKSDVYTIAQIGCITSTYVLFANLKNKLSCEHMFFRFSEIFFGSFFLENVKKVKYRKNIVDICKKRYYIT